MQQQAHPSTLKDRLGHAQTEVRRAAVRDVARQNTQQTGMTAAVIALVSDKDEQTRYWAAEALDRVVRPEPDEVPVLIDLIRNASDGEVEYWTATMLGRLGSVASRATGVLAAVLLDSSCLAARERAAWALSQIGPAARSSLNALRQIGQDDPPRLRRLAEIAMESLMVSRAA